MNKSFYIENLGCSKNQVDAETIIALMKRRGWTYTDADSASVIIINTCGFIKEAKEESIQTILGCRENYPDKIIIAAGCLSQRYGNELAQELTEADGFIGNRDIYSIPKAVEKIVRKTTNLVLPEKPGPDSFVERTHFFNFPRSAYVKIAEGCCNNCTYCAIPIIRGPLRSVPMKVILDEVKNLVERNFYEINLVSQDMASYGTDIGTSLKELLTNIMEIEGDFRVRILYIHPDKFNFEILPLFQKEKRLLPYFDIPFQHASGKVLAAMGRKGDKEKYLSLVKTIRDALPDCVIRSTFMLGFPGEKDDDFDCLIDFLQKASLDWCGFFTYSKEDGTKAASLKGRVAMAVAKDRKEKAEALQTQITEKQVRRFIGKNIDVLVEELIPEEDIALGRGYMHAPEVDGAVILHSSAVSGGKIKPGDVISARVIKNNNIDLEAVEKQDGKMCLADVPRWAAGERE